ncbi:hypothetical protein Prum_094560 [Phytohabitans rumicis]|uniref:Glycosyl hydrolase n=1 Tax=Phytohabitans rumicis TaxID=1076125 RepID=A0A6V8LI07_9ACTN|nr:hypothetical protein Prum_094560 [Phytohabitans rumicis]
MIPSTSRLRPLAADRVTILDGFWGDRLRTNRERTIPHGFAELGHSGVLDNLRLAAGMEGRYRASADSGGSTLPFVDSDAYKWLEAVGWELGRGAYPALAEAADEVIGLIGAAQQPDGYVNSFIQLGSGQPHQDLAWSHEFYCAGHLIQAAVAWHRAVGDDRLLEIAVRAADRIDAEFGPGRRDGIDGHPVIEMALVELTRVTGDRRYLALAARMIDLRGYGLLGDGRFGRSYWQDHAPVRDAAEVAGHAVRQLYLDAGAVDVAVELDDDTLLDAVRRRWDDLMHTRTYLTGGMGSRHRDEAFGDPYELPPDRAYTETCAAIASVMLAWRLLLATGDPGYADAIERGMYNGVLPGISLSGTRFFYTNPLQRRTERTFEPPAHGPRAPWYACACCPPNLMRLFSSWQQYLATSDASGVQLHQYTAADVRADVGGDPVRLIMRTDYPWSGRVAVHVVETPDTPWTLSLRVPAWCRSASITGPDGVGPGSAQSGAGRGATSSDWADIRARSERSEPASRAPQVTDRGMLQRTRTWRTGDAVVLELDMPIRVTEPDPRIDAVRGCVAVERGPLVYCVESADTPPGVPVEDLRWDASRQPAAEPRPDLGPAVVGVTVPLADGGTAGAIPYYAWANRDVEAMRVWLPLP